MLNEKEKTIEKFIALLGEIEYDQIPETDGIAWKKISDYPFFSKIIFLSSYKDDTNISPEKDYNETSIHLKKTFLQKCKSGEYNIIYCPKSLKEDLTIDPIFIRLYWIATRKELEQLNLIRNFIELYYLYTINTNIYEEAHIKYLKNSMGEKWIDTIRLKYRKYAKGSMAGIHFLNEICQKVNAFIHLPSNNNGAPFHPKAQTTLPKKHGKDK